MNRHFHFVQFCWIVSSALLLLGCQMGMPRMQQPVEGVAGACSNDAMIEAVAAYFAAHDRDDAVAAAEQVWEDGTLILDHVPQWRSDRFAVTGQFVDEGRDAVAQRIRLAIGVDTDLVLGEPTISGNTLRAETIFVSPTYADFGIPTTMVPGRVEAEFRRCRIETIAFTYPEATLEMLTAMRQRWDGAAGDCTVDARRALLDSLFDATASNRPADAAELFTGSGGWIVDAPPRRLPDGGYMLDTANKRMGFGVDGATEMAGALGDDGVDIVLQGNRPAVAGNLIRSRVTVSMPGFVDEHGLPLESLPGVVVATLDGCALGTVHIQYDSVTLNALNEAEAGFHASPLVLGR